MRSTGLSTGSRRVAAAGVSVLIVTFRCLSGRAKVRWPGHTRRCVPYRLSAVRWVLPPVGRALAVRLARVRIVPART